LIQHIIKQYNISSTELFTEYTLTIKQHKSHANKFLAAASFITAVLYVGASVCGSWTGVQRGTCHVGSCSDLYIVLLFCLYFLAILVCNFACDLCCFIVNVYSVKSSVELMLYCFIMCWIKIKFSYVLCLMSAPT
jgi:hypothetical protein